MVVEVLSGALLVSSVGFVLLAAVGLHRFDDVFSCVHAATKAVTFGVLLAAAGTALALDPGTDTAKLALAAALQLVTAPVSAHLVSRAAYRSGTELSPYTVLDQLADVDLDPTEGPADPNRPASGG
ncbi:MAG: monovalent cation/H(+) antiporter subunit G [Actinomycetota bacterium]